MCHNPSAFWFQARVYLLSAGFSLTFGSMFAKTYRVHRIFTHSWAGICKDKMLRDTKLISMVCCLLLVDALVVTFWTLSDPMERHLRNLTLEISLTDRSVVYQPQVCLINWNINSDLSLLFYRRLTSPRHLRLLFIQNKKSQRSQENFPERFIKLRSKFNFPQFIRLWRSHFL